MRVYRLRRRRICCYACTTTILLPCQHAMNLPGDSKLKPFFHPFPQPKVLWFRSHSFNVLAIFDLERPVMYSFHFLGEVCCLSTSVREGEKGGPPPTY